MRLETLSAGTITAALNGNASTATSATNADTVDSLHASQFLRSDANDSTSGILTSTNSSATGGITVDSAGTAYFKADRGGTDYAAGYQYATNGTGYWWNYISSTVEDLKWYSSAAGINVMTLTEGGSLSTNGQGTLWGSSNDGSGSGLDADLWDGNQFSSYLNQAVLTTSNVTHNQLSATDYVYGNNLYAASGLIHWGDGDTSLIFTDNTITLNAGGSAEVTVNSTGVRLGDIGNGYFQPVSGSYGSIQIDGGAHGGYEGYSIGGRVVFMHDNVNSTGLYDDVNNNWLFQGVHNGSVYMYHNGVYKLNTHSTGANIQGDLNAVDNIYLASTMYHEGDTDTYLGYGTDTIELVTGGVQRFQVNSTGVRLGDIGNGYFQPVTGNYGSIQIDGGAHGGWEGYSIGGRVVFMHDNGGNAGIYNDVNNHWLFYGGLNGGSSIYYAGGAKLTTTSSGINVTGTAEVDTLQFSDGSTQTSAGASTGKAIAMAIVFG
jgi:hypothetical protein